MLLTALSALALSACVPDILPTAEMIRATNGKPDKHEVSTCGGGENEFGGKIKPWKCLIWTYEDKGIIFFGDDAEVPKIHYHVKGCRSGTPTITKDEGFTWHVVRCVTLQNWKEKPCNEIGLGADPDDDFTSPPPTEDDEGNPNTKAWAFWAATQGQTCATLAEAQKAAKLCAAAASLPAGEPPSDPSTKSRPALKSAPSSPRRESFGELPAEGAKL